MLVSTKASLAASGSQAHTSLILYSVKDSCSEGRNTTDTHKPETELDHPAAVASRAFGMSPAVAEDGQALQASHFDLFVVGGVHATHK